MCRWIGTKTKGNTTDATFLHKDNDQRDVQEEQWRHNQQRTKGGTLLSTWKNENSGKFTF